MIEIPDGILAHNSIPRMRGIDIGTTFMNPLKEKYSLRLLHCRYNGRKKLKLQTLIPSLSWRLGTTIHFLVIYSRSAILTK
jgi:hypothetical protein